MWISAPRFGDINEKFTPGWYRANWSVKIVGRTPRLQQASILLLYPQPSHREQTANKREFVVNHVRKVSHTILGSRDHPIITSAKGMGGFGKLPLFNFCSWHPNLQNIWIRTLQIFCYDFFAWSIAPESHIFPKS